MSQIRKGSPGNTGGDGEDGEDGDGAAPLTRKIQTSPILRFYLSCRILSEEMKTRRYHIRRRGRNIFAPSFKNILQKILLTV